MNELNLILENAKSFATKAGVSKHSNTFHDEFIEHEKEAKKWLKYSTIILIAITAIAIVFLYVGSYFSKSSEIIQLAITKVIVLSTLFYGLGITNRNYRAHKHNSVMNKHRQNALITFETFSNASSADNQTKNAVLLEATHTIFSTHQTGYLKTENESESNNKIVEIIKSAATKAD